MQQCYKNKTISVKCNIVAINYLKKNMSKLNAL